MADLLIPGVWWLHGTRGSNVYLVEADDGSRALVDTGFPGSASAILREAAALGVEPSAILLTHKHRDHAGSAGELRERTSARLVMGRGDCAESGGRLVLRSSVGRSHVARFLYAGARHAPVVEVPVDTAIDRECEVLPGIRAVPAPGHTDGSLCFVVDRLGVAFVGDLVISHGGRLARSMRLANRDDRQYLETLKQFAQSAPSAGCPGHGEPLLTGFGDALRELAALPRSNAPANLLRRPLRLWRFAMQMMRTRRPR